MDFSQEWQQLQEEKLYERGEEKEEKILLFLNPYKSPIKIRVFIK